MTGMAAKQLVVQAHGLSGDSLDAVDRRAHTRPWDYADPSIGRKPAVLGTAGLLRLAAALVSTGYRIAEVDIRDSEFSELSEDIDQEFSSLLRRLLNERDDRASQRLLLDHELVLVGVTVRMPKSKKEFSVNRDGELRVLREGTLPEVVGDLGLAFGFRREG